MSRCSGILVLVVPLPVTACQSTRPGITVEEAVTLHQRVDSLEERADRLERAATLRNPLLNSTLWMQTAVEYRGTARQAYALAEMRMEQALTDSTWTASLEQAEVGSETYRIGRGRCMSSTTDSRRGDS